MITQTTSRHSTYLSRTALAVILAAMTAGCSGAIERFEEPIYTGGTNNQRSILSRSPSQPSLDEIAAGPTSTVRKGKVESVALPPPTGSVNNSATGSIPKASSQSHTFKPVASATSAAAAPSAVAADGGKTVRGWTTTGGTRITARQGESVASISRRYGVPQYVLADINGIDANASLQPGQNIIIPTYVYGGGKTQATASQTLPPQGGAAPSVTGSVPVAAAGAIAALPRAKPSAVRLASAATTASDAVKVNKPSGKPADIRAATAPAPHAAKAEQSAIKAEPARIVSAQKPEAVAEPTKVAAVATADPDEGRFRWPVRGRIISDFGVKPGGARNDGINLAVPEGTEVKAADDGVVIYSGNELKGYGNLVLVRHSDGWVSAYAHNSKLAVSRGDNVRRGDTIGYAGTTGSVTQPQVHFELRRGNKPIDPLRYLAKL